VGVTDVRDVAFKGSLLENAAEKVSAHTKSELKSKAAINLGSRGMQDVATRVAQHRCKVADEKKKVEKKNHKFFSFLFPVRTFGRTGFCN